MSGRVGRPDVGSIPPKKHSRELPRQPIPLGVGIESTSAVWDGLIVVGIKGGYIYGIR